MEDKLTETVGRRRRVAVAGYHGDEVVAREGLADAAGDVRATALGALLRMGRLAGADVLAALADSEPVVRRRACDVSTGVPVARVTVALTDSDALVVEAACFALGERAAEEGDEGGLAVPALARVATGHSDPLCREAAIAALGSIGDPGGLTAILAGLGDKAAVRRRAVIALAPFEGPAVDEALATARSDRDWQVRQAAEDLLAPRPGDGDGYGYG